MSRRFVLLIIVLLASYIQCWSADAPSPDQVKASLRKATEYLSSISTEGGYLWRYSTDLSERWGEDKATATQIWVQPPGTPAVGMAFLDAYAATKDSKHLTAAQAAAMALVRGQLESGGWYYVIEFDPKARAKWDYHNEPAKPKSAAAKNNTTEFDDDNTQSALQFLMSFLDVATNRPLAELKPIRDAVDYGLSKMIAAQYPNGGWPQRYQGEPRDVKKFPVLPARFPTNYARAWPKPVYWVYYTLNDNTQRDCIRTMLQAYHRSGDKKYLTTALKGGEFLMRAQLPEPQPTWAQQYNFNMEPAWARAFEPPCVCSAESVGAMRTLVDLFLETGDAKFLKPIPSFINWLKRSQIGTNKWARYYELGSNRPIYGDRDGKIHYKLSELSSERQHGYGWQGEFGVAEALAYYEEVQAKGREKMLAERGEAVARVPSRATIAEIISQQNPQGRWTATNGITMRTFITNMERLSAYLRGTDPVAVR